MHAALQKVLGNHVAQKGSLVNENYLRFDFSHTDPVTADELTAIERLVNDEIRANSPVDTELMSPDEAQKAGAMALFGEKYGDLVRVLTMGDFSKELCGGTHVSSTGDIGLFRITSETGIAAGIRRIEAVSGAGAVEYTLSQQHTLQEISSLLKTDSAHAVDKIQQLQTKARQLEREIDKLNARIASGSGSSLEDDIQTIGEYKLLVTRIDDIEPKALRETVDKLKDKIQSGIVLMATVRGEKISLIAGVTKNLTSELNASTVVNHLATQVGGKGGGRPDMAQAGGDDIAALDGALNDTKIWLIDSLNALVN